MNVVYGLLIFLQVYFDGVPVSCIVDTGATGTILSAKAANTIGTLRPLPGIQTFTLADGRTIPMRRGYVPNVGTEHLSWPGATVSIENTYLFDCILGTDLLGQQPIVIDWQTKTVKSAI